ncbi:Os01g0776700 [Oryza sativa Japonica Group]|uniref:Os01g0776700 protein n=1 Tax=Oryza sativa subsp. japonica TaxID=39947 RepID=Q0JIU7_ORYSJ|nr:Os01g0776700 [Oryza sativa Japonica Group]|eukprot:NP_001044417.2 Os01g0776700 [Oryza sativa Japonica Group]
MASLTTTTAAASSPAALPAASTTAPASSVSPAAAAAKRPHLAGDDAPWRAAATGAAGIRPVPRIHHAPVLRVAQDDYSAYALAVMKVRSLFSVRFGWWGKGVILILGLLCSIRIR